MTWMVYGRKYIPPKPRRTKLVREKARERVMARYDNKRQECPSDALRCPESDGTGELVCNDLSPPCGPAGTHTDDEQPG